MQQLDDVFDQLAAILAAGGELAPDETTLLKTWIQYDRQYLVALRQQVAPRYLRATIRMRLGQAHTLLKDHEAALVEYQDAIELLKQLNSNQHSAKSFELAFAQLSAGNCLREIGDETSALAQFRTALHILSNPKLTVSPGSEQLKAHLRDEIKGLEAAQGHL